MKHKAINSRVSLIYTRLLPITFSDDTDSWTWRSSWNGPCKKPSSTSFSVVSHKALAMWGSSSCTSLASTRCQHHSAEESKHSGVVTAGTILKSNSGDFSAVPTRSTPVMRSISHTSGKRGSFSKCFASKMLLPLTTVCTWLGSEACSLASSPASSPFNLTNLLANSILLLAMWLRPHINNLNTLLFTPSGILLSKWKGWRHFSARRRNWLGGWKMPNLLPPCSVSRWVPPSTSRDRTLRGTEGSLSVHTILWNSGSKACDFLVCFGPRGLSSGGSSENLLGKCAFRSAAIVRQSSQGCSLLATAPEKILENRPRLDMGCGCDCLGTHLPRKPKHYQHAETSQFLGGPLLS